MFLRTRFANGVGAAIAAGLLVAAFGPATAAPQPGRAAQSDDTTSNTMSPATAREADKRRYCVRYTPVGTRIEKRDCKTRAQWWAEGVDIDNPND